MDFYCNVALLVFVSFSAAYTVTGLRTDATYTQHAVCEGWGFLYLQLAHSLVKN